MQQINTQADYWPNKVWCEVTKGFSDVEDFETTELAHYLKRKINGVSVEQDWPEYLEAIMSLIGQELAHFQRAKLSVRALRYIKTP